MSFRRSGPFDKDFDVPYTTAQTGLVRGGVALNTVPSECEFDFEIRDLPGTDVRHLVRVIEAYGADLEAQMKAVFDGASVHSPAWGRLPHFPKWRRLRSSSWPGHSRTMQSAARSPTARKRATSQVRAYLQ
ncbi:hypothetical protein BZM27_53505 [Paraburkholderia steynii]|uniref:Peptidase M20 dimerisation domain-containing protein n=1 Tax=Paraburkholderia steynii TaxID=1245441 RepID=A0A4R0WYX1_9BURK|nr:hypothetical protein BZM27_53505 [Paraburkholderia steynii]